jgi:hypothetical protein
MFSPSADLKVPRRRICDPNESEAALVLVIVLVLGRLNEDEDEDEDGAAGVARADTVTPTCE